MGSFFKRVLNELKFDVEEYFFQKQKILKKYSKIFYEIFSSENKD